LSGTTSVREAARQANWSIIFLGFGASVATAAIFAMLIRGGGDWNQGLAWERSLMLAIPHRLPFALDLPFLVLPWLSSNTLLFPLVTVGAIWLVRRGRGDIALQIWIVDLGTFVLTPLLKVMFDRARPALWPSRGQFAWASYPSGHAMIGLAVFTTIAIIAYRERGLIWPAIVLAIQLCVSLSSRLYLGMHWPTDIVGGLAVGAVWLAFTLRAFAPRAVAELDASPAAT
jgi:undecaprenyl-diphosphatase